MSALMIATITVTHPEKFQQYLAASKQLAGSYGAELVTRAKTQRVLTGEEPEHELTVIARFPDVETINRWYDSADYQALVDLRNEGTQMRMTSYAELNA
jgi:uncharacterized protein (DUF1330 family)